MKISTKHKLIFCSILISVSSLLSEGCSRDKIEINDVAAVMGIGIDKIPGADPILITIETAVSKSGKGESSVSYHSAVEESKGKTFADAVQNLLKSNSQTIDFSHAKIIILSQEYCESGISDFLDYANRDRELRSTNWLLVSNKPAGEILKSSLSNEDITSKGLSDMMDKYKNDGSIIPVNLNEYMVGSQSEAKSSFIPLVELKKSENSFSKKVNIEKIAIFKNNHLIGTLTNSESNIFLWLSDKVKGNMTLPSFTSNDNKQNATITVYKKSSKIIPYVTPDNLHIKIECKGDAAFDEVQNINLSPEIIKKIEVTTETMLKDQLDILINRSQKELNTDFIGFSKNIYNNYPKQWNAMKKDWNTIFPNVKYEVTFDITLTKIGLSKNFDVLRNESEKKNEYNNRHYNTSYSYIRNTRTY